MYLQIANIIKNQIAHGELGPGTALGSNNELAERYKVSRVTVRQALKILNDKGFVISHQGKGTYVAPTRVEDNLNSLLSLAETINASGLETRVKVIDFALVKPPSDVRDFFRIENDAETVMSIKRQHLIGDIPIAIAVIHIPRKLGEQITADEVEKSPLYKIFEEKLNIGIGEATQFIRASKADSDIAKFLQISKGSPVLTAERLAKSRDESPLEHIRFFYHSDRFQFRTNLWRAHDSSMWPLLNNKK